MRDRSAHPWIGAGQAFVEHLLGELLVTGEEGNRRAQDAEHRMTRRARTSARCSATVLQLLHALVDVGRRPSAAAAAFIAYSARAIQRRSSSVPPGTASASAIQALMSPWLPSIIANPPSPIATCSAPSASPMSQRNRSAARMFSRSSVSRSNHGS